MKDNYKDMKDLGMFWIPIVAIIGYYTLEIVKVLSN